jgi:ABC-type multidrug transport system permease subunit
MNKYIESYIQACLVTIFGLISLISLFGYITFLIDLFKFNHYILFTIILFISISIPLAIEIHNDPESH